MPDVPMMPLDAVVAGVATRICHDLAGLVGTLGGALDLLDDDPEAAPLARDCAGQLTARLRLFRAAWGGNAGALDGGALAALARGLPGAERLTIDFSGLDGALAEAPARLVLCLLLSAAPALPRGTVIWVTRNKVGVRLGLSGGEVWPRDGGVAAGLPGLIAGTGEWQVRLAGSEAWVERA
jgi:histidine phosphotransferase ChpT